MSTDVPVPTGEIGTSGLRHYSGFLQEEFEPKLRGRRAMELYREMRDNSAILGASFQAIQLTMRKVEWCVEPASTIEEDQHRATFVEQCLHDMSFSWTDTVIEHLTCIQYGFAPSELVYKRRLGYQDSGASSRYEDGMVGWAKVALRGQETITRWDMDLHGGIRGFWQSSPPDLRERYIPISKALLFRVDRERNNPEGRSALRSAYWDYYGAKRLTESMLIGAERDLAGFPVARVPSKIMAATASPEEKAVYEAYKTMARDTRRGDQEGMVIPSDRPEGGQHYHYDFQLLSSGGKREFNVAEMVRDRNRMIAIVLLTDMLLMGHEGVGSYALADAKSGLFGTSLDGYLEAVAGPYNAFAIPRLLRLNGWRAAPAPILKHKPLTAENIAALADFLQKMVASKIVTPEPDLEQDIRKRANLRPRPEGVTPASNPPPPNSQEGDAVEGNVSKSDDEIVAVKADAAGVLVRAGYLPADAAEVVGLPPMEHLGLPPVTVQAAKDPAPPPPPAGGDEDLADPPPPPTPKQLEAVPANSDRLADGQPPLRVSEVAAAIGCSRSYVQKLLTSQALTSVRVPEGRERRVPVSEVRRLQEELRA